jgi:hypothetical protein
VIKKDRDFEIIHLFNKGFTYLETTKILNVKVGCLVVLRATRLICNIRRIGIFRKFILA